MESFSNKGKRCLYRSPDSYDIMCWRRHVKCTRVRLWYTFAFVFANMMSSAIASVHIMAANSIAPDLCEKMLRQFLRWLWTSFFHIRWKNFTVAPPVIIQNDWGYVPATTTMWRRYQPTLTYPPDFSKSLVSVNVSKVGCAGLVFVAATTMMNCCCNDCCVFVINRNAFLWSVNALS